MTFFIYMNFKVHVSEDMSVFLLSGKTSTSEAVQRRREGQIKF